MIQASIASSGHPSCKKPLLAATSEADPLGLVPSLPDDGDSRPGSSSSEATAHDQSSAPLVSVLKPVVGMNLDWYDEKSKKWIPVTVHSLDEKDEQLVTSVRYLFEVKIKGMQASNNVTASIC
jgi:hypothetical protein